MTRDDLAALRAPAKKPTVKKLRDSHHQLARLAASGLTNLDIAARSGRSLASIVILKQDPAMIELIEHYRGLLTESWRESADAYYDLIYSNQLKAERQIADKLDEADERGELLPTRELIAIARDAADRTGYGKRSTNVNVNVDFAAKLEAAMARSQKVIDHE
jgi:hypothetical protein